MAYPFPPPPAPPTLPPLIPIPSGLVIPLASGITDPGVYFFETMGTTPIFLASFSGGGFGKIFEGDTGIYIMGTASGLVFSDDNTNFSTINSYATSVTQIEEIPNMITVVFKNTTGTKALVETQAVPERYGHWTSETTVSGVVVSDTAGDPDGLLSTTLPILVGNSKYNAYPRIYRNDVRTSPLGAFTKSDTGIPSTAQITELEAV